MVWLKLHVIDRRNEFEPCFDAIDLLQEQTNDTNTNIIIEPANEIDLIYINIFEPNFFLYILFGPALALALIGALVHVATQSCSSEHPVPLSKFVARHLLTYPEHVCFHRAMTYPGHTGRVLRATWSIFWLIICSAYVAFMATEFTTKPPEVPIDTLQKLIDAKDFKIGITATSSSLVEYFKSSENKTVLAVWDKLLQQNLTDNITLDPNIENHAQRILKGRYAFINGVCKNVGICDERFSDNLANIRAYQQHFDDRADTSYATTPKNVFYFEELYKALLRFEEQGLLQYLRRYHFKPKMITKMESNRINNENGVVTLSRILLPVYITIGGASVSLACLVIEVMYNMWAVGSMKA